MDTKLHQLARVIGRHYDAELRKAGLRTTQFWLLTEVLARGPVSPGDLAASMDLDPSTITRNLKPLLALGWLAMGPGTDGRTRTIRITSPGRAKCAEAERHWTAARSRVDGLLGTRNVELEALISECLARLTERRPLRSRSDESCFTLPKATSASPLAP